MSAGATGLTSLSLQLTRARFVTRQGESLLYLASTLAYAVCSSLALTVAGGTWMFWNRYRQPTGLLADVLAVDPSFTNVLMFYVMLAIIACALLVPSLFGLAASAAVLGARGRERRLSALRLLGVSAGDVTRMSLIDTAIQAGIGCVVGTIAYLATVPLWSNMQMQSVPIGVQEMTLPWWLLLSVLAATLLIGLGASWWGLRQVRISPLGVARRANRPALRAWRVVVFVGVVIAAMIGTQMLQLGGQIIFWIILGAILLTVVWGLNLVAPWFLQLISKLLAKSPSPSMIWAARRIESNPKTTWQMGSGIALMSFIGGYISMMPLNFAQPGDAEVVTSFVEGAAWDFTKGALITLAVGLVLTATSVLITQASAVLERAEQARALDKMGAPRSFLTRATWLETLGPLVLAMVLGSGLGIAMATPMAEFAGSVGARASTGTLILGSVLIAGLALVTAALLATRPLQRQVLAVHERPND
ncbi:hypothetical protein BW730_17535 [Tessaracoccus aquimaris]|uniref:ABC3 transporter permease C-terminal domain-containing protein n=1 Tax=Tessaracoccus aquimaris TaxID=1332264 RepID=A0A1Q2CSP3_9ACTN|nr:FtsX-like permease family protein [Tessaracoccus aquimaris]AQP49030.1 hypothetical protein BW730_17535 [Tessaracoccus aquimaris]